MGNITLDKYDIIISSASGIITAAIDAIKIKDISLSEANKWGSDQIEDFVIKVANKTKVCGKTYKGNDIKAAILHMEKAAPIMADDFTDEFGGGRQHHLRDFSHHPTPVGILFSILNQFTGRGFGTDTSGKFIMTDPVKGFKRGSFLECIYSGTITWMLHMVSDMAGSSSNPGKGTGIPGPFMSFLKELSSVPGVKSMAGKNEDGNYNFSYYSSKLFNGTLLADHDENGKIIKDSVVRFDLRTELGLVHEPIRTKQYEPVLLSEGIICAFYSVRQLINEIRDKEIDSIDDLKQLDFSKFLPWKNDKLKRMRTISALSFTSVDMTAAAVSAYAHNKGDKLGFAVDFASKVNYFGVGRLIIAGAGEVGMKFDQSYDNYRQVAERVTEKVTPKNEDVTDTFKKGMTTITTIAGIGTPIGFISATIGVYKEIKDSSEQLQLAREDRIRIEKECQSAIAILEEYQSEMENVVSEYMVDRLTVFGEGLDMMDEAIKNDDSDSFIKGNNMIQEKLGHKSSFASMDEFDDLMMSDDSFKM